MVMVKTIFYLRKGDSTPWLRRKGLGGGGRTGSAGLLRDLGLGFRVLGLGFRV